MAKVVWTREAERWLLKIHDYIALDKPAGSGENGDILHWVDNSRLLKNGDRRPT